MREHIKKARQSTMLCRASCSPDLIRSGCRLIMLSAALILLLHSLVSILQIHKEHPEDTSDA